MALNSGTRLGPYEILSALGAGGMGEVYKARDTRLDRFVAVKVLPGGLDADPEARARFEREARTISALDHPNICALYDFGEQDGRAFIVMPYLEGETLAARLSASALPLDQALRIAVEISDALDKAHRHGIVHRDLKPGNVILTKTGAKLLDFGLAKHRSVVGGASRAGATVADAAMTLPGPARPAPLTEKGTILGTFHYMAPEQLRGEEADARSDIYALGAVIYEMVSGQRPFDAADTATLIAAILERQPRPLSTGPGLPARLERAIAACLEKDPGERWQSARDLLRELTWIADEHSRPSPALATPPARAAHRPSRHLWLAGAVLGAVAIAAAAGFWARFGSTPPAAPAGPPVIVMMDSPHPARVYDPATLKDGGTNADDLTDLLRDLPVELVKETSSTSWRREDQVLRENPSIFLVHRSCFFDATLLGDPALDQKFAGVLYPAAADKLEVLLGYIALANPRTRFVVYSRGSWATEAAKDAWVIAMTQRFPGLKGRLVAYKVPLDRATFRNPQTGSEMKAIVQEQLALLGKDGTAR